MLSKIPSGCWMPEPWIVPNPVSLFFPIYTHPFTYRKHIQVASNTTLVLWGHHYVKQGLLEYQHCDTMSQSDNTDGGAKWPMGRECVQCESAAPWERCEVPGRGSGTAWGFITRLRTMHNLKLMNYFWKFPFIFRPQLLVVN